MPLRVLVTGHNGYLGSILGPFLQACGHVVVGLDSGLFRDCTFGAETTGIPCLWKDVRDIDSDLLRRYDAVVHLAGIDAALTDSSATKAATTINRDAVVSLVKNARKAGVSRVVVASDYAGAGNDIDVPSLSGGSLAVTVLRLPSLFGLSPRFRADLTLNGLAIDAYASGIARIPTSTEQPISLLHVEDAASAFATALLSDPATISGRAIEVVFERLTTTPSDLGSHLRQAFPASRVEPATTAGIDTVNTLDYESVRTLLPGCFPRWSIASGLQQLADAFFRWGLDPEPESLRRFRRAEHIEWLIGSGDLLPALRWSGGIAEEIASWAA
jgi:nucleoside-diphosphate-sugar epimerase